MVLMCGLLDVYICSRDFLPERSEDVLVYAMKHDYQYVMDAAARYALKTPLERIVTILPAHFVSAWVGLLCITYAHTFFWLY